MLPIQWRVWFGVCACTCLVAASGHAQKITVRFENSADSVVVRVVGDSPFRYTTSLVGPGCSVNLDLQAHLVGSYRTIRVASGGVSRMWVGWYQARPPITRLRIVTTERRPYRVERSDDGRGLTVTVDKRLAADPSERLAMPSEDVASVDGRGSRLAAPAIAPVSTVPGIDAPDRPVTPVAAGRVRNTRTEPVRRPMDVRAVDLPQARSKRSPQDKAPVTTVEPTPVQPDGGVSPATPAQPPVTTPPVVPQTKVNPVPVPVAAAVTPADSSAAAAHSPAQDPNPVNASGKTVPQQSQASMVPISETHSGNLPELLWVASGLFGMAFLYTWIKRINRPNRSTRPAHDASLTYKRPVASVPLQPAAAKCEAAPLTHAHQPAPVIAPDDVKRLEQTVEQLMLRLDQKADEVIARIERERNGAQCDRTNVTRPDDADEGRTEGRRDEPASPKPVSRGMRELLAELDRLQKEGSPEA